MAAAAVQFAWNENWEARVTGALDEVGEVVLGLDHAAASAGVGRFAGVLRACRESLCAGSGTGEWKAFIACVVRNHPSFALFQEDPFTRRSFVKPRGYAGDPELLDLAFEHPASFGERGTASRIGQFVAGISTQGAAARAVRDRRGILARAIDETAWRVAKPRILSLASGHLREVELSNAFRDRQLGRLVAMDHDPHTAEEIRLSYRSDALELQLGGPCDLLKSAYRAQLGGHFDLVFSAGLYDYLSDRFASRLLKAMFEMLAPGGRLLIANFVPDLPDVGYMEAFMDWWLIYRTPQQLCGLVSDIDSPLLAKARTYCDATRNIVFLEVTRH